MEIVDYIAMILALFSSLILHEMAHSYVAYFWGDSVSKLDKRLSFNPINHIDIYGSFIIPFFLIFISSPFIIGYAKPVMINYKNFRNRRWGLFFVALAGPLINIFLASITIFSIKVLNINNGKSEFLDTFILYFLIYNIIIAAFNLLPFPPLDGSNIMKSILPKPLDTIYIALEPIFIILFIIFLVTGQLQYYIRPVIEFIISSKMSM